MFKSILMPVEPSREATWEKAFPAARQLLGDGGTLHVVTVVPMLSMGMVGTYFPDDFEQRAMHDAGEQLNSLVGTLETGSITVTPHVLHGPIGSEIIAAAKKLAVDAVVMASHRPDMTDWLIGANALRVVQHAPMSVFVIRN